MKKILILGSCVSRDIFEFDKNGNFEIINYYARTSLASLALNACVKEELLKNITSTFQKRVALWDMNKNFWNFLKNTEFDYLLLDLIDDRFALYMDTSKSGFTLNAELYQNNKNILDKTKMFVKESKKFKELFSQGLNKLRQNLKPKQLIVNEAYLTEIGGGGIMIKLLKKIQNLIKTIYQNLIFTYTKDIVKFALSFQKHHL